METLYMQPHIEITYHPDTQILFCRWIGYQTRQGIEEAGGIILDLIKQRNIKRILNDNSLVVGPWHHTANWTHEVWFPAVIDAGLKHFAWVLSENMFASVSAKKAMPHSPIVKPFVTYEQAHSWLLNLPL
jgi:hypothetical protein